MAAAERHMGEGRQGRLVERLLAKCAWGYRRGRLVGITIQSRSMDPLQPDGRERLQE
ncbi:MAG: hypothetical protein ACLTLQ_18030 [[Clostridium] scindens]